MNKKQAIADLLKVQSVYRNLYEELDPEGALAVHIEFDEALADVISYLKGRK